MDMGLRIVGLACLGLFVPGVAAVGDGWDVPQPAGELLATLAGEVYPGHLRLSWLTERAGDEGRLGRIETEDGNAWLFVSASDARKAGGTLEAGRFEVWSDTPLISIDDARISETAAGILADGGRFRHQAGMRGLASSMSAAGFSANYADGTWKISVRLDSPTGRLVAGNRSAGHLNWSAEALAFEASGREPPVAQVMLDRLTISAGGGKTGTIARLEIRSDSNGTWQIIADGVALSSGLASRFRPIAGLEWPPLSLSLSVDPIRGGRRNFTASLDAGPAAISVEGWSEAGSGPLSVTAVEAAGLLELLKDAGAIDPLAAAARMGLYYDQASQEADMIRSAQPQAAR